MDLPPDLMSDGIPCAERGFHVTWYGQDITGQVWLHGEDLLLSPELVHVPAIETECLSPDDLAVSFAMLWRGRLCFIAGKPTDGYAVEWHDGEDVWVLDHEE